MDNLVAEFYFRRGKSSHCFYHFSCRNHLLLCILNICKYVLGRIPKVVGIDVVEMALWAKVHMMIFYSLNFSAFFQSSSHRSVLMNIFTLPA